MVVKKRDEGGYADDKVFPSDLDSSVLALMGSATATDTYYVSTAFSGKTNPYFSSLEAALIANNATGKSIIVYPGTYYLTALSSINNAKIICQGNVILQLVDMYNIIDSSIDSAYLLNYGQTNINNSFLNNCSGSVTGSLSFAGGTSIIEMPKTNPLNIIINNNTVLHGTVENLATTTIYGGTGVLEVLNNAGSIANQWSSGNLKLTAETVSNISNSGTINATIKMLNLGANSVSNFGKLKINDCIVLNNQYYAFYGGSGSTTILRNVTVNSTSNGYGVQAAGNIALQDCIFLGKSSSGVSVITSGTLNAFNVIANGSVTGTNSASLSLSANSPTAYINDDF